MMCRVDPESWMPLRCMTNVIGARWTAAALKPFSACPEIQPASPQWTITCAPVAVTRPQAERGAGADREHDAEPAGVELGAARHPRHVPGDVEAAPEPGDDALAVEEAERRQRRVVADARVAVLDGELRSLVVGGGERHQERGDQLEAAAQMVDVVDGRQRRERLDRRPRGLLLDRRERQILRRLEAAGSKVERERQDAGFEPRSAVGRVGKQRPVARVLIDGGSGKRIRHSQGTAHDLRPTTYDPRAVYPTSRAAIT